MQPAGFRAGEIYAPAVTLADATESLSASYAASGPGVARVGSADGFRAYLKMSCHRDDLAFGQRSTRKVGRQVASKGRV
ncbi:MAG: hypothetical protein NVS1B11_31890 [Terriglobales bacterium]